MSSLRGKEVLGTSRDGWHQSHIPAATPGRSEMDFVKGALAKPHTDSAAP